MTIDKIRKFTECSTCTTSSSSVFHLLHIFMYPVCSNKIYLPICCIFFILYGTGQKKLGHFRKGLCGNPQIFYILLYSRLRFAISASAGIISDVCKQTNNTNVRRVSIGKPCNLRRKLIRTYVEHFDLYLRIIAKLFKILDADPSCWRWRDTILSLILS